MEWKTIDSAPRDGTKIDGWVFNSVTGKPLGRVTNIWWNGEAWQYGQERGFYWDIEVPIRAETGEPVVKLSHWMPLPTPPGSNMTPKSLEALSSIADGKWHSIPDLVREAGLGPRSGGAFGSKFSRLQRMGLAEVAYDETGYWSVARYRITEAGRALTTSRKEIRND